MNFIRYEESRPEAMRAMIRESPVAYVPFGSLEWHGEHAPLGVDGLKAHALCEAAAERTGGVVFPAIYWGAFDTMPFPFTFHFKKSGIRKLARQTLRQLAGWNFKAIVLLAGHYPASQVTLLRKECRRFNKAGGALAIGIPEQAFAIDIGYYGDHAGMWETSFMMAIRPELVDLSAMPAGLPTLERLAKFGVMGQDPISKANAEKGRQAIEHITQGLAAVLKRAMDEQCDRAFEEVYENYDKALSIFSRSIVEVARKALDVRSIGEFIRYEMWTLRNLWRST
jgi:creatinine amidohydrolase